MGEEREGQTAKRTENGISLGWHDALAILLEMVRAPVAMRLPTKRFCRSLQTCFSSGFGCGWPAIT